MQRRQFTWVFGRIAQSFKAIGRTFNLYFAIATINRSSVAGERTELCQCMLIQETTIKIAPVGGHRAVQDHSRSLILIPIKSLYVTLY